MTSSNSSSTIMKSGCEGVSGSIEMNAVSREANFGENQIHILADLLTCNLSINLSGRNILMSQIILLRLSRGTPSVKNIVAKACRGRMERHFLFSDNFSFFNQFSYMIITCCIGWNWKYEIISCNTSVFFNDPFGNSIKRTFDATSDFFLRLIIH